MSRTDYIKPVKTLDFDFVFTGCPIELCNGAIYSEVEDHRLFLSLTMKNLSDRPVEYLLAKVWLYDSDKANLPYVKLPLEYDLHHAPEGFYTAAVGNKEKERIAQPGEAFGTEYFFPMPESFFTRLAVEIKKIRFTDSSELIPENVTTVDYRRMDTDFDDFEKKAYERINIYRRLEKQHPSKVVPMEQENLWICCCGEKNPQSAEKCVACSREKAWQLQNLSKKAIESYAEELKEERTADMAFLAKTKKRSNVISSIEEEAQRRRAIEREEALRHVKEQQKKQDFRKKLCFFILLVWIFASVAFYFLTQG